MEKNFYNDNFEKYLKDHADQFKLYPGKNAWRGLYNNLHPGMRWPSLAMSVMFIIALFVVGHLNTNDLTITSPSKTAQTDAGYNSAGKKSLAKNKTRRINSGNSANTPSLLATTLPDQNQGAANNLTNAFVLTSEKQTDATTTENNKEINPSLNAISENTNQEQVISKTNSLSPDQKANAANKDIADNSAVLKNNILLNNQSSGSSTMKPGTAKIINKHDVVASASGSTKAKAKNKANRL
nr:hypothetical protein [Chitinophagaceae bacterium]